jgi:hypothetical protein
VGEGPRENTVIGDEMRELPREFPFLAWGQEREGRPSELLKIDAYARATGHVRPGLALDLQPGALPEHDIDAKARTE